MPINVLVNNAGVMPLSPLHELKIDEWNRMIDVNIRDVLHGIAVVLPGMRARKSGQVVCIMSRQHCSSTIDGLPGAPYSTGHGKIGGGG